MIVFAIPFLLERGHSAAFAAFAVGLFGVSQIPGRVLFAPLAARLPRPHATAAVFVLLAAGVAVVVSVHATWAAVAGLVLLGMGNGMATLARATGIADLYGGKAYGTIASVAGSMTTTARAAGRSRPLCSPQPPATRRCCGRSRRSPHWPPSSLISPRRSRKRHDPRNTPTS